MSSKNLAAFFLFIANTAFATYQEDPNPDRIGYLEASVNDLQKQLGDLKEEVEEKKIYPPAGASISGGSNVYIVGDFIYWKAGENGLGFAVKRKNLDGNGYFVEPSFTPDPGFRIGLGWNTDHDDWDLYLSWTRLHTGAHAHRRAKESQVIYSVFANSSFATTPVEKASARLKIHLNVIQLEMGREFYVGKQLSVRPHVGFENAWISQHYTTRYQGHLAFQSNPALPADFNSVFFRNHFWGIGARAGMDSQWELGWGFSVTGDLALALLYGQFNLKRTSDVHNTSPLDINRAHIDQHFSLARAAMEFCLGLRWDWMFAADRFHFAFLAGWEQLIYFGQNQIFNFMQTLDQGKLVSSNHDLTFQGLTLSARLDF